MDYDPDVEGFFILRVPGGRELGVGSPPLTYDLLTTLCIESCCLLCRFDAVASSLLHSSGFLFLPRSLQAIV